MGKGALWRALVALVGIVAAVLRCRRWAERVGA